jgi:hypothetical protein
MECFLKNKDTFCFVLQILFVYLIQSDAIYLTVNRLTRIRMRCGQRIRN